MYLVGRFGNLKIPPGGITSQVFGGLLPHDFPKLLLEVSRIELVSPTSKIHAQIH